MQRMIVDTPHGPLEIRVTEADGKPVIDAEWVSVTPSPKRMFTFTANVLMADRVRPLPCDFSDEEDTDV